MIIGTIEIVTPATIMLRSAVNRPKKNIVPSATGRNSSRCTEMSGKKNWIQMSLHFHSTTSWTAR